MDFPHFLRLQGKHAKPVRKLDFQDRVDILLEMRVSGVAKKGNTCYMGNPRLLMLPDITAFVQVWL